MRTPRVTIRLDNGSSWRIAVVDGAREPYPNPTPVEHIVIGPYVPAVERALNALLGTDACRRAPGVPEIQP